MLDARTPRVRITQNPPDRPDEAANVLVRRDVPADEKDLQLHLRATHPAGGLSRLILSWSAERNLVLGHLKSRIRELCQ